MKAEFKQPIEREVVITMSETEAKLLSDILDYIGGGGKENKRLYFDWEHENGFNHTSARNLLFDIADALEDLGE